MKNRLVNISLLIGFLGFIIIFVQILSCFSHETIIRICYFFGIITILLSILSLIFNKNKLRAILVLIIGITTILLSLFYNYYLNSNSKILNKIDEFISGKKIETDWENENIDIAEEQFTSTQKTFNSLEELKAKYNIDISIKDYYINNKEDEFSAFLPITVTNNEKDRITLEITISAQKDNKTVESYTIDVDSLPQNKSQNFKAFTLYDQNEINKVFGSNISDYNFIISKITIYLD